MTPYIVTVYVWEPELDNNLHNYNFIIYAENYTDAAAKVDEYCGDAAIDSMTIKYVAESGTLVSVPFATAAAIIEADSWHCDEL